MESIIQANIFFFISSVATLVLAILAAVFLVKLIRVIKKVEELADTLKESLTRLQPKNLLHSLFNSARRKRKVVVKKDVNNSV